MAKDPRGGVCAGRATKERRTRTVTSCIGQTLVALLVWAPQTHAATTYFSAGHETGNLSEWTAGSAG